MINLPTNRPSNPFFGTSQIQPPMSRPYSSIQPPMSRPYNLNTNHSYGQRFGNFLNNKFVDIGNFGKTLFNPQDDLQRKRNMAFAQKLSELSRPQLGVPQGLQGTLANLTESLSAGQQAVAPQIRQLGNVLVQINPDGSIDVLSDPSATSPDTEKPLSGKLQSDEDSDFEGYRGSMQLVVDSKVILNLVNTGQLKFSAWSNAINTLKNLTGWDDNNVQNFMMYKTWLEQVRNARLRLAKGVQTEGDAQRVMNELVSTSQAVNTNGVKTALGQLIRFGQSNAQGLKESIQRRRIRNNLKPYPDSAFVTPPATVRGAGATSRSSIDNLTDDDQISTILNN